jgi:hypothetical protein
MRCSKSIAAVLSVAVLAAIAGCGGEKKPEDNAAAASNAQITPGQLSDQIIKMAAQPNVYSETAERHILTGQLASMGPATLAPLIDYMAAPTTAPTARLFILQCVSTHLTPVYIVNLKPMLESTDEVTRAVGVMAIGHIKNETVAQLLTLARKDPSPRVSFSALSGLVMQGDAAARTEMKQLYTSGAPVGDIKEDDVKREAVRVIVRDATAEDLPMLEDALNQPFLEVNSRVMVAETLGRLADASAIPLLQQSLNLQKEPEYGEMVQQAIAAINGREKKA